MDAKTLLRMYRLSHGALRMNLDEIDHDDSLVQPQPAGNCINWVIAHILAVRDQMFGLIGLAPVLGEAGVRFGRSSEPLCDGREALPLPELLSAMDTSQQRLEAALGAMTEEQLAAAFDGARLPGRPTNVAEMLAFFHFHESYHVGQVGLLRRVAGKEGAIR